MAQHKTKDLMEGWNKSMNSCSLSKNGIDPVE